MFRRKNSCIIQQVAADPARNDFLAQPSLSEPGDRPARTPVPAPENQAPRLESAVPADLSEYPPSGYQQHRRTCRFEGPWATTQCGGPRARTRILISSTTRVATMLAGLQRPSVVGIDAKLAEHHPRALTRKDQPVREMVTRRWTHQTAWPTDGCHARSRAADHRGRVLV